MPQILSRRGYQVTAASTVAEALQHIATTQFDVLISDLNIGEQHDGMTVVSAMRRTQPDCLTLILTGYPGFDTAVEALRNQVDEYLIKPAPPSTLLDLLEQKLAERQSSNSGKRIHEVLREYMFEILQRALRSMRQDVRLGAMPLDDEQRADYTPQMIENLAAMLEASDPYEIEQVLLRQAELLGMRRYHQGYTVPLVASYMRHVERAIFDVIHDRLSSLDESHYYFDLKRINCSLAMQLEHALQAFLEAEQNGERLMVASRPSA
jgi:ActR/RegA family two-component response regulator